VQRLILFLDDLGSVVPSVLTRETLRVVKARPDIHLAAVCVSRPKSYHRLLRRHLLNQLRRRISALMGREHLRKFEMAMPLNLKRAARLDGFRILSPPSGNLNAASFVEQLENDVRPTMALTFLCGQRFDVPLLKALQYSVNYHDGALPGYRASM